MNKNENEGLREEIRDEFLSPVDEFDKKLEDIEDEIKMLKKLKKRQKKLSELQFKKEEILREISKKTKNKHK